MSSEIKTHNDDADAWAALLSVLAHDIASPLTALRWQTELLLGSSSMPEVEKTKTLHDIHESVLTGIGVTQTVGYAVNVLRGDYESSVRLCSPREVVTEVVNMLAPQFDRHRVSITTTCGEMQEIVVDSALLKLAVWALLKRALVEAPSGTAVSFIVSMSQDEHGVSLAMTVDTGVLSGTSAIPTRHSVNATLVFLRILMASSAFLLGKVTENGTQLILTVPPHTSS